MRLLKPSSILFAAVLVSLVACQKAPPGEGALELRIYDPPKSSVRAIVNTLNGTMWFAQDKIAGDVGDAIVMRSARRYPSAT
jgi:hypothetical protein